MTVSAIYQGAIRHRRYAERRNEFRHGLALVYLDLDELPALLGGRLVATRPGAVRFRRSDYLGDPAVPLADAVRDLVGERTGERPAGPVRVLTQLRSFGHCFNPVSFYYCYGPGGDRLEAVVAEVTNTPWGERHAYVLRHPEGAGSAVSGESRKVMHVSPFMGMDHVYRWNVAEPADVLSVDIQNHRAGEVVFDATLSMRRRELNPRSLAEVTLRYPAATIRVLALIYAHAVGLKLRGVGVHRHPEASGA